MELDFALLASNVDMSATGTLHLFGAGFEALSTSEFPFSHRFSILTKMLVPEQEIDQPHSVRVMVTDPAGVKTEIVNDENIRITRSRIGGRPTFGTLVFGISHTFVQPGTYGFSFFADGREVKAWTLYVDIDSPDEPMVQ